MPLKVIAPDKNVCEIHSPADFEKALHIRYLSELQFDSEEIRKIVERKCERALAKEWITPRQKWLGHYYAEGIRGKVALDLAIAWMSEGVGYGLWTNRDILPQTFIGEYTGLLRKRKFWGRWKNRYCFDYTIGPRRSTSLVIDCKNSGNHTRFINHSSHSNLDLVSVYYEGMIHVILIANKAIPAGTQLFYDYGEEYWTKREKPLEL